MAYKVAMHPAVRAHLYRLYQRNRPEYEYVKKRLLLLAYKPDMGQQLRDEFRGKWRVHIKKARSPEVFSFVGGMPSTIPYFR